MIGPSLREEVEIAKGNVKNGILSTMVDRGCCKNAFGCVRGEHAWSDNRANRLPSCQDLPGLNIAS